MVHIAVQSGQYAAPVLSVLVRNIPYSGDGSVTVSGLNFGTHDYTATQSLASGACGTSSWTSETSLQCFSLVSTAHAGLTTLTVGAVSGTATAIVTFDAPVASFARSNAVVSSRGSVTVSGLSFGLSEHTATAQLVSAVCMTSAWTSATSVGCQASALWDAEGSLYDVMRMVQVTVGGVVGTMTEGFSFDGPVASFVSMNVPSTGRGSVTVSGLSFGLSEATMSGSLASAVCVSSSWSSSTSLTCLSGAAIEVHAFMSATVNAAVGTGCSIFTFDGMLLSLH